MEKSIRNKSKVIVLLSGGMDSTASVHYYLNNGYPVRGFFVDYGQSANEKEKESVYNVSDFYKIDFDIITVHMGIQFGIGEIRGRNAFFLTSALMKYPAFSGIIAIGIHAGTPYYDTSENFVIDIKRIVSQYADGKIQIDTPFIKWQKPMIYQYCLRNNVPINLTYSCEKGTPIPCGSCNSCLDMKELNVCQKR